MHFIASSDTSGDKTLRLSSSKTGQVVSKRSKKADKGSVGCVWSLLHETEAVRKKATSGVISGAWEVEGGGGSKHDRRTRRKTPGAP